MQKRHHGKIWRTSSDEFALIVKTNNSFTDVLRSLGLKNHGGNCSNLRERIKEEEINVDHIILNRYEKQRHRFGKEKIPLEDVLIEKSTYSRGNLKLRLIEMGLLEYTCSLCDQLPIWKGERLVLVLDHINGINDDNRLNNLRFLCPNCNSQTKTFAGRNRPKIKRTIPCSMCFAPISKKSVTGLCIKCFGKKKRKVERPDINTLKNQIQTLGYVGTSKLYGVSDVGIRKWLR